MERRYILDWNEFAQLWDFLINKSFGIKWKKFLQRAMWDGTLPNCPMGDGLTLMTPNLPLIE